MIFDEYFIIGSIPVITYISVDNNYIVNINSRQNLIITIMTSRQKSKLHFEQNVVNVYVTHNNFRLDIIMICINYIF